MSANKKTDWVEGRQGSGYFKKLLFMGPFFDGYLLKFPTGSHIDWHTDPVPGKRHWRFNWIVKHARRGGIFERRGKLIRLCNSEFFRADLEEHKIHPVVEGEMLILSIGVAI